MQSLVAEDLFQEEVRKDALAHEPALEVGEHAEDRVDLAGVRELFQLLRGDLSLLIGASWMSAAAVVARRARSDERL